MVERVPLEPSQFDDRGGKGEPAIREHRLCRTAG